MAIPTSFGPITPEANVTNVFPLIGNVAYGIDVGGSLTPSVVSIAEGMVLYMDAAKTTAQIVDAMKAWLQDVGRYHDGAGGFQAQASRQFLPTKTLCT